MRTTRYAMLLTSPLGPEGSLRAHLRDKLQVVLARPRMYAATAEALEVLVLTLLEALDFPGAPDPPGDVFNIESVQNRWLLYARQRRLSDRSGRRMRNFDRIAVGLRDFAAQERAREAP